jgi:opacity protein-like surface antigen
MKKILLCTTALVGFASSALAADMTSDSGMQVTIGGNSKFEAGYIKRDKDHKNKFTYSPNQSSSAFMTSNKANIKAEGKNDMMTYGAVVRLQTVANMSNGMSDSGMDRSHIFMQTDAGAVQMGTNFAASKLMSVDAGTIASATGGVTGDYETFVDAREDYLFASSLIVLNNDTLTNRIDGRVESAQKITYLSPRISGVQLGMSFAPDLENNGGDNVTRDNNQRYLSLPVAAKNLFSVALNYKNNFDDVNVTFSAAGDFAKANNNSTNEFTTKGELTTVKGLNRNDVKTYSVGTVVEYQGFSAALSYANDGKSLAPKEGTTYTTTTDGKDTTITATKFKSSWMTAGLGYKNGPMSTSLTYLSGERGFKGNNERTKTSAVSLGADYEVAPGMKPFAEVTLAEFKPKNTDTKKQKSTVFILGTRVKF